MKNAQFSLHVLFLLLESGYAICAVMIVVQMAITANLALVFGETISIILGGIVYITIMVHNGAWEIGGTYKSSVWMDALISTVCAAIFSVAYALYLYRMHASQTQIAQISVLFFAGIAVVGFTVLRVLTRISRKNNSNINQS